jgi:hypothetical protein
MNVLAATALIGLTAVSFVLIQRVRGLLADVARLTERADELAARLGAAEHDVGDALLRTEIAETVLLEKGLADEEDLEAARRRSGEDAADARRDGELH